MQLTYTYNNIKRHINGTKEDVLEELNYLAKENECNDCEGRGFTNYDFGAGDTGIQKCHCSK